MWWNVLLLIFELTEIAIRSYSSGTWISWPDGPASVLITKAAVFQQEAAVFQQDTKAAVFQQEIRILQRETRILECC